MYVENAYGMPIELLIPLVKELSKQYRVLVDSPRQLMENEYLTIEDQTNRILKVLDEIGIAKAGLVGWCSGCGVLLNFAQKHSERVNKMVLLNGSYLEGDHVKTLFEKNMVLIMPKIVKTPSYAKVVQKVISSSSKRGSNDTTFETEVSGLADSFLYSTNASLFYLTSKPFETEESIISYAKYVDSYVNMSFDKINEIEVPVLCLTGDQDTTTSILGNEYTSNKIGANSSFEILKNADHFMLYHSSDCRKKIVEFLQ